MALPIGGGPAFREHLTCAQSTGKVSEDFVVIAGLAHGLDQPAHVKEVRVVRGTPDILALEGSRGRKHDVRPLGRGSPPGFVHDDRVGLLPSLAQPAQVLVVVEGVAAAPVDQPDVRVDPALPVEFVLVAGIEQHVRDTCHRDGIGDGIVPLGESQAAQALEGNANSTDRAIPVADATSGQADLAQHRCEHRGHPVGLFPVLSPLQRPRDGDQRAGARHPVRKGTDFACLDPANAGCPFGGLGLAVRLAEKVSAEPVVAGRAPLEERAVDEALRLQNMGETEHQGGISARYGRQPLGTRDGVRSLRADIDEMHALRLVAFQPPKRLVLRHTAHAHL